MMRSMFSGVSGLRIHQTKMDAIGNNIANINTIGYKSSTVNFQSMLSQTIQGASTPEADRGGSNPIQVGLGAKMSSIDTNFAQGNLQSTGNVTDMAIQGEGFFILQSGAGTFYTRAGNFTFDADGNLVNPSDGSMVQGWVADDEGNINTNVGLGNIDVPINQIIEPRATTRIRYSGNLPSTASDGSAQLGNLVDPDSILVDASIADSAAVESGEYQIIIDDYDADTFEWSGQITGPGGEIVNIAHDNREVTVEGIAFEVVADPGGESSAVQSASGEYTPTPFIAPIEVIDSQGNSHEVVVSFSKAGSNAWNWEVTEPSVAAGSGEIIFNNDGSISNINGNTVSLSLVDAQDMEIELDFGTIGSIGGITQFATGSTVAAVSQNGNVSGTLESISIGENGEITGMFDNGQNRTLAQIAMALFTNPSGLLNIGDSFYAESNNSGVPVIGPSATGGRGQIIVGTVEMSNVDLAKEFADMIVAQRGFQANSRIISASDEMLQELAMLKR